MHEAPVRYHDVRKTPESYSRDLLTFPWLSLLHLWVSLSWPR
jgi:hypothetical protein